MLGGRSPSQSATQFSPWSRHPIRLDYMTPEDKAGLEINVAADPGNGPIYIAAVDSDEWAENGSGWSSVVRYCPNERCHSVAGITYRHYAHRAPLAFKAIMTLPQPTAFSAMIHGHDGECPCCRRPFADAG